MVLVTVVINAVYNGSISVEVLVALYFSSSNFKKKHQGYK